MHDCSESFCVPESAWEYILTRNGLLAIQKRSAKTVGHRDEIVIGHLRSVQLAIIWI